MIEVEIKIPVGDLKEVREGLQRKGFAYERSLIERLKLRAEEAEAVRLALPYLPAHTRRNPVYRS